MCRYAVRKKLNAYCRNHGCRLYRHRIDGDTFQFYVNGVTINGFLSRSPWRPGQEGNLWYDMYKTLLRVLEDAARAKFFQPYLFYNSYLQNSDYYLTVRIENK